MDRSEQVQPVESTEEAERLVQHDLLLLQLRSVRRRRPLPARVLVRRSVRVATGLR